jgi:hypothetical protein
MIPAPNDHALDRAIADVAKQPNGRIDISRDEWLSVLMLLRDTRQWVLALRVKAGDCTLPAARPAEPVGMEPLIREADRLRCDLAAALPELDRLRRVNEQQAGDIADYQQQADVARHNSEQLRDAVEAETIMQVVSYLGNLVEGLGSRAAGHTREAHDAQHELSALHAAAEGIARGNWRAK